ncbi:FAD-dependent oxidoreductase [Oxalobacteraceae bacterium R-40]|uniref:FAD-dependent oxidoreductase n=1 Tax=Keguizhuia sedimenti TaxID=3064264 RepID=A0ABU1BVR6_9BURK|nr:FAD-dependent oxidoreductase [Oxalobacteraceae bacterium R-40]
MKNKKLIVAVLVVAGLAAAYLAFDLGRFLNLEFLKSSQRSFQAFYEAHPLTTVAAFFILYVLVSASSLPGAAVMTLAGGALFGLTLGTLVVSFASALGATLAFLAARYFMHDWIRQHFRRQFETIDEGIARGGRFYLLTLRLVPIFPFFIVNLLMGLTKMRTGTYYWVSQLGMLPGTIVYVNAGTQLAQIESLRDILSPAILGSFVLLGLFPLIAQQAIQFFRKRKIYRGWHKPARFDCNMLVIGAGSGGLVAAYIAAAVKAKVILVEAGKMGGDCLNTGCVPSKALIRSARFVQQAKDAQSLGIGKADLEFDFAQVMERVSRVIKTVEPHDSVERYTKLGVEVVQAKAKLVSPWEVEAGGRRIAARAIVIAAGARPFVPPIPGLDDVGYVTSDTLWSIRTLPKRLVVLGGGPIGCELAQAFARFGSQVIQVERSERLLGKEDPDIAAFVQRALEQDGVTVHTGREAVRCERAGETRRLYVKHVGAGQAGAAREETIEFDLLLCALGRAARTEGYGLEELGIPLSKNKTIETDAYLQTLYPNIFACGDVAGPYQFTHTAAHQAWFAVVNGLFGGFKRFRADYSVVPWCTFTSPEVARVGLSEDEAKAREIDYEVTRYDVADLDRAIAEEAAYGFVKVLTEPGKDKILGVAIVAEHAGELLAEYVLAMKHGIGLNKILGTIHVYPTMAEANKHAAGEWRRAHAPQRLLGWVERYHAWRRGPAPEAVVRLQEKA